MTNETISLTVESSPMQAYVARPEIDTTVGVIVFQEAFGVNQAIKEVADRFAQEGYLAIAPELFHRSGSGIEVDYSDFTAAKPYYEALTPENLEADAKAAYEWLVGQGMTKVVAVGFCLGGRVSFIANSALPLAAAVSYYGGGIANLKDRIPKLYAPMLFFWGGKDTHNSRDAWGPVADEMNKQGKEQITVEMGAAGHAFANEHRPNMYHQESAELAWPLTLNFIRQKTI